MALDTSKSLRSQHPLGHLGSDAQGNGNGSAGHLPPIPKVIRGAELTKLVRDPNDAALAAVELIKGRLIVEHLTIHQALRVTSCDPFKFMELYGLKPAQRAALKLGEAKPFNRRRRKPTMLAAE
jgi:hypothetical protein